MTSEFTLRATSYKHMLTTNAAFHDDQVRDWSSCPGGGQNLPVQVLWRGKSLILLCITPD